MGTVDIGSSAPQEYTFTALTVAGSTDALPVPNNKNHTFHIRNSGDPSGNIMFRVEHSYDGTYWSGFDTSGNTGDGSANISGMRRGAGNWTLMFKNQWTKYVRFNLVSKSWTTSTVSVRYTGGG